MSVEWRRIEGFGDYEVSSDGELRSFKKWRGLPTPRLLHPRASRGYLVVALRRDDGRKIKRLVHRLVGTAFFGPLPEGMVTRHLNGDPLDNRVVNLRYGTPRENNLDLVAHGCHPESIKTHCKHGHEFVGDNLIWGTNANGNPRRRCRECERGKARRNNWRRRGTPADMQEAS